MAITMKWIATACLLGTGMMGVRATEAAEQPLLIHVGGTMRPAMEAICKVFTQETGRKVEMNYNDSGAIITVLETTGQGDACMVHDPFPASMEKRGWVDRAYTVATLTPVIAVKKGNPKSITGLQDLTRSDVKVGLTDAIYSTGGHVAAAIFRRAGIAGAMRAKEREIVRTRSGGEMANAVSIGTLDAAIVWNAVVFTRQDSLEAITIPPDNMPDPTVDGITSATYGQIDMSCTKVVLMTLKRSKNKKAIQQLAEFTNSQRGREIFAKYGFSPAPLPMQEPSGKLTGSLFVYCAAGLKEPMTEITAEFEKKTGVKVETTYANSGQLLGQIQTTRIGDVYIPGESGFITQATSQKLTRGEPREFCHFLPVILVRKGNPKRIHDLVDLTKPGIKLALADESAAIGKLQNELFTKNALDTQAIIRNTINSPAMVTDVALSVKLGTVDAGIVWNTIGALYPDSTEIVAIPLEKNSASHVHASALAGAKNPEAAQAFLDYLASDKAKTILANQGFGVRDTRP